MGGLAAKSQRTRPTNQRSEPHQPFQHGYNVRTESIYAATRTLQPAPVRTTRTVHDGLYPSPLQWPASPPRTAQPAPVTTTRTVHAATGQPWPVGLYPSPLQTPTSPPRTAQPAPVITTRTVHSAIVQPAPVRATRTVQSAAGQQLPVALGLSPVQWPTSAPATARPETTVTTGTVHSGAASSTVAFGAHLTANRTSMSTAPVAPEPIVRQRTQSPSPSTPNFRFKLMAYENVTTREGGRLAERMSPFESNLIYATRALRLGDALAFEVDKVDSGQFETSFVFGVTTCSQDRLDIGHFHLRETCRRSLCGGHAFTFRIYKANRPGDRITFERRGDGLIYVAVNGGREIVIRMGERKFVSFKDVPELTPFVQLNGFVSRIKFVDSPSLLSGEVAGPSRSIASVAVEHLADTNWKTSSNVVTIDNSLIVLDNDHGRALNQQPLRPNVRLAFKIRDVKANSSSDTLSFALVDPLNNHFRDHSMDDKVPPDAVDMVMSNIVSDPAPGLVFILLREANGDVSVRCRQENRTLFKVHPKKDFWPLIAFSGSVRSIELMRSDPPNVRAAGQTANRSSNLRPRTWTRSTSSLDYSSQNAMAKKEPDMSAVQSSKECSICMTNAVDCAIISCGHQKTCMECAEKIMTQGDSRCPICRSPIESLLKVYPD